MQRKFSEELLCVKPIDPRATGLTTVQDLEVFKMSSNYQGMSGGVDDYLSMIGSQGFITPQDVIVTEKEENACA